MGLAEMSVILFTLITVGQYIIAWAVYAEKKYTAVSIFFFWFPKLYQIALVDFVELIKLHLLCQSF